MLPILPCVKSQLYLLHVVGLSLALAAWAAASDGQVPGGWHRSYAAAREAAKAAHKPLLVWFCDPATSEANRQFQSAVCEEEKLAEQIAAKFVAVNVERNAPSESDEYDGRLIDHAAFAELRGQPGLAIIDFADESAATYGCVVSIYPFTRGPISAERLAVLLDLPPGTLTQRTLIFAVRTHADGPASATGDMHPLLAAEAAAHVRHQASINLQGHHNWDLRFQAINARLPAGHVSFEVCAESWPGQSLLDAAEECVASWRQSGGHWGQVSRQAECYGYDMQRGTSGVWYATGIFGRRR